MSSPADKNAAREKRWARRRAAEQRFRLYGVAAVLIAAGALATLVISIGMQSVSAFASHRVHLEVEVPARASEAAPARDYGRLLREAVFAQFPEVRDRRSLGELNRLVHSLNAARLRDYAEDRLGLEGGVVGFAAPLGDDLDLFLKGRVYPRSITAGETALTITPSGRNGLEVTGSGPVLNDISARVRERLGQLADRAEADAASREAEFRRAQAALDAVEAQAEAEAGTGAGAADDTSRARLARQAALARSLWDSARAQAEALRQQAGAESALVLNDSLPSVLLLAEGGVAKLTELGAEDARGSIIAPAEVWSRAEAITDWSVVFIETPEADRARSKFSDTQAGFALALQERGVIRLGFNTTLFTAATSNEPELAGLLGALVGSLFTMLITMVLAVPVGVAAAVYLEEFAPQNRFTDIIEININNLAAVPSIVFGLLGAAVFLNFFGQYLGMSSLLGRGFPLVGGLVLALMTLPTVIITTRAALRAVPPSVRAAALSLGASRMEAVRHHVLPAAMPGILTGAIIGLAQALGETAPLLLIGMAAFVADIPEGITSSATVMPVQIFQWTNKAERAFATLAAAAILVLLAFMIAMNIIAVVVRRRFERRWE